MHTCPYVMNSVFLLLIMCEHQLVFFYTLLFSLYAWVFHCFLCKQKWICMVLIGKGESRLIVKCVAECKVQFYCRVSWAFVLQMGLAPSTCISRLIDHVHGQSISCNPHGVNLLVGHERLDQLNRPHRASHKAKVGQKLSNLASPLTYQTAYPRCLHAHTSCLLDLQRSKPRRQPTSVSLQIAWICAANQGGSQCEHAFSVIVPCVNGALIWGGRPVWSYRLRENAV